MRSKWLLKALVQKTISFLPYKERINYWFQRHVTKGVRLTDEYFGYKITHAADHLRFFRTYAAPDRQQGKVLELGTGWYPVVPIALYLSGIKEVTSVDLRAWLDREKLIRTVEVFREWKEAGKLSDHLPEINPERWEVLMGLLSNPAADLRECCAALGLTTIVGDARQLPLADASVDLICSNNTFEHIPRAVLAPILVEFRRVIRDGGVMSHFIDLSDHFAHFDPSITIYNFLRFDAATWALIDNSIQPQNRMRWRDYRELYVEVGLPINVEEVRPGDLEALASVPIADEFREYTPEELAVSHGYLVSRVGKRENKI